MFNIFQRLLRVRRPERAVNSELSNFRILAEGSPDAILRIGMDMRPRYVSPACARLFGVAPEELIGGSADQFIVSEDVPKVASAVAQRFAEKSGEPTRVVFRIRKKDTQSIVWIEGSGQVVRDAVTGEPEEFVVVARDITEHVNLETRLLGIAMTDGLTGVANRRAFDDAIKSE